VHPVEKFPGVFIVKFTPRVGGRYLAFADVSDGATKTQRYVRGEIRSAGERSIPDYQSSHQVTVDGFNFDLKLHHELSRGKGVHAVVSITDKDGKPVRSLEPIMGAFAHGVGFSKDLESVLHVHPHGEEPRSKEERAGPQIAFHISPERPGFHRLYVQVKIHGREVFAPFGVDVAE
jgi:hypothetical protein